MIQREIRILKQGFFSPGNVLTRQLHLTGIQVRTVALVVQLFEMKFSFLINSINGVIRYSEIFAVVTLDSL